MATNQYQSDKQAAGAIPNLRAGWPRQPARSGHSAMQQQLRCERKSPTGFSVDKSGGSNEARPSAETRGSNDPPYAKRIAASQYRRGAQASRKGNSRAGRRPSIRAMGATQWPGAGAKKTAPRFPVGRFGHFAWATSCPPYMAGVCQMRKKPPHSFPWGDLDVSPQANIGAVRSLG
jgi:hypothetical protein